MESEILGLIPQITIITALLWVGFFFIQHCILILFVFFLLFFSLLSCLYGENNFVCSTMQHLLHLSTHVGGVQIATSWIINGSLFLFLHWIRSPWLLPGTKFHTTTLLSSIIPFFAVGSDSHFLYVRLMVAFDRRRNMNILRFPIKKHFAIGTLCGWLCLLWERPVWIVCFHHVIYSQLIRETFFSSSFLRLPQTKGAAPSALYNFIHFSLNNLNKKARFPLHALVDWIANIPIIPSA